MKRRAIYAMLVSFCMFFFFSTAKTNSNIGKNYCCGHATIQKCATPSTGDLEISLIHYVLLNI
jgi:hypothetical protein